MLNLFGNNRANNERKRIRSYFVPDRPKKDYGWMQAARLAKLLSAQDFAKIKINEKSRNIPEELFDNAVKARKELMERWDIRESDVSNKPSGAEMDESLLRDFAVIMKIALNETGLKQSQLVRKPTLLFGPILSSPDGIINEQDILVAKDRKDEKLRFTAYQISIIFLGEDSLNLYDAYHNSLDFDNEHPSGSLHRPRFYIDIDVDIATVSSGFSMREGEGKVVTYTVQIVTASRVTSLQMSSSKLRIAGSEPKLTVPEANIRAIQQLVLDKKRKLYHRNDDYS